ncbi:MAG: type IV secretion system DNA-binding domain-containing protein [Chthoniobacterales bacterium]|nr:type IV secretion system DNA-binding domain-containing protein [Chthoniobacterales bacterium]
MLTQLSLEELCRHLIVFGTTGCGKTLYVLLPLLRSLLARNADNPEKRAGALILDVKGDMLEHIQAVMAAAGRSDDLLVIGRQGNSWVDPFVGQTPDSRAAAERIMQLVRGIHSTDRGGSYDDFWKENNRRLLQVAAVLTRARQLGDMHGIGGIADALDLISRMRVEMKRDDDDEAGNERNSELLLDTESTVKLAEALGAISDFEAKLALEYLHFDTVDLASSTWGTIMNYARSYVSCLTASKLSQLFTPSAGWEFAPDEIMDHGRVVVVSLSRVHYGPEAEVFRTLIKTAFQTSALQRRHRFHFDGQNRRPVNCVRPVYFVGDEFPSLMTPGTEDEGDSFFLDKCRDSLISCILTAQSVSALSARALSSARVHHLLNNCATKVFMSCDCPETLAYFESASPLDLEDEGGMVQRIPVPPPPAFRLPNYQFGPATRWRAGARTGRSLARQFTGADLRRLKTGEAVVFRATGEARRETFQPFLGAEWKAAGDQAALTISGSKNASHTA